MWRWFSRNASLRLRMAASVTPEISTSAIRYALNITGLSEEFNHSGKIVEANLLRRASFWSVMENPLRHKRRRVGAGPAKDLNFV